MIICNRDKHRIIEVNAYAVNLTIVRIENKTVLITDLDNTIRLVGVGIMALMQC